MIGCLRTIGCITLMASALTSAQAGSFVRVTTAGQPVRIASHATWNGDCEGGPALIEVVVPLAHGRLLGIEKPTTITRIEMGRGLCRGHRIEAEAMIYRPAPGFRGSDQFAFTSTTANGTVLTHQGMVAVR